MALDAYYVGVDVGTGSARASLFTQHGGIVASHSQDTITWRDPQDHRIFEQSTANIWSAIAISIRKCLEIGHISPSDIKGLGFDATCSLAVTDIEGEPVVVTRGSLLGHHGERNIILWADHRAEEEADIINKTRSVVLDYVGGAISVRLV